MNTDQYDIYFPHLGIGIEKLQNSISIFGFRIAYYGIIIGIGMLLAVAVARFDYKRRGQKAEDIEDLALYSIVLSVLGARAYYVIFEWSYYAQHLDEILNIRKGGLAIYGGILTGILCCLVFCRRRKIPFFSMADSAVLGLLTGQSIGRWGNFFNAEAFGRYTDSLFAMRLKESIVNPNMLNDNVLTHAVRLGDELFIQVHPTFLYESVWNLCTLLFLLVTGPKKKFTGQIFWEYLMIYGIGRFFIEGLRTDSLLLWGTGLAVSQLLSGGLALLGLGMLVRGFRRQKKKSE